MNTKNNMLEPIIFLISWTTRHWSDKIGIWQCKINGCGTERGKQRIIDKIIVICMPWRLHHIILGGIWNNNLR